MRILVTFAIWRDGKYWAAKCLELGVVSCGDDEAEALENIKDATLLYLNTLEDQGECEQVLKEKHIKLFESRSKAVIVPSAKVPAMRSRPALFNAWLSVPVACSA